MQQLGNDHVLPVPGDRFFISAACQLPDLADQGGRGIDIQVKYAAVPAPVHDFGFTGKLNGFRDQNDRMGCPADFPDQARNQSGCPGCDNPDARHQTS